MNKKGKVIGRLICFLMLQILLTGIFPFNGFALDDTSSDAVQNEETVVSNTGMSPAPGVVPLSITNGYEVYFGTANDTLIGTYDTLADACAAVNNDGSGADYTILVTADDPAMGTTATIDANKTVTLTSPTGASRVITQSSSARHISVSGGLILENITLDGGKAGGGLYVSGGTLEINDGAVITKCSSSVSGSGIYIENSAMAMNGGEISDNHQSTTFGASGGGVYMGNSTFTMNDGKIINNSAVWGGGVEVSQESTFTMNGGEISYNKSTVEYGGGVHVYVHGTFIMNNGTISNNKSSSDGRGGGVFVGQASHVSTEPTDWAKFIMNGGSIEDNEAFVGGGVSAYWNGQVEMTSGTISNNTAAAGGGVSLGYSREGDDGVYFIMTGGKISGNTATSHYGGGIWADGRGGSGTQYSIKVLIGDNTSAANGTPLIYGNKAGTLGGGIYLYNSNTHATIYDGKIYGNTAGSSGGGICVDAGSTLNFHGGSIGGENSGDANIATLSGGGIATISGSNTFNMTDGKIIGNEAGSSGFGGGGIYLENVNYAITGGEISSNTATNNGGGLYLASSATASAPISQTSIVSNKAAKFGGGAYISNIAEVEDVTISNNNAGSGGGVYVPSNASFTVIGKTSITNNSAADEGGGIYTEDYTGFNGSIPGDYSGVRTGDYGNITTNADSVFSGNIAFAAYEPPVDADQVFSNIGYAVSSIMRDGNYMNPINNYDINYAKEPRIAFFTVTYDANGGAGSYSDTDLTNGSSYTILGLSETGISRDGYQFIGWNTAADASGTSYAIGDTFTISSDITLYAQWEKESPPAENEGNDDGNNPDVIPTPSSAGSNYAPKTGDNGNIILWVSLACSSLIGVVFLLSIINRKRNKYEKD